VVEHLPSKCKDLSSTPVLEKKKKDNVLSFQKIPDKCTCQLLTSWEIELEQMESILQGGQLWEGAEVSVVYN
jgi:hypothetical protein